MIHKILIANRGEIAVRVIRACQELSIPTVAVFSEADRTALHVRLADEAVCIGPPASRDSYLDMHAILSACELTGADAIHPGFGFLSENSNFVRLCEKMGITFIGPSSEVIRKMGDKAEAKHTMKEAGVPVVPGSEGLVLNTEDALLEAERIGFPLLMKASAGGGGRGIRVVRSFEEVESQYTAASTEALNFFGDSGIYMEKYLENPRHIEIQILADSYGNVVHLGERDCSIQRRNQKILEESPSPSSLMTAKMREKMGEAAVLAAQAVGYANAGTLEFLLDQTGDFYFMEMNTRIQVEHPVTEEVSGVDLLKWQIRIAQGEKLPFLQGDVSFTGHAIECRINAENPAQNFRPSPGTIRFLHFPGGPGVRVESAVYSGYTIPPYYDSMIVKIIAKGKDRLEALARMRRALREMEVDGVETNLVFQRDILNDADFIKGNYTTGFLGTRKLQK